MLNRPTLIVFEKPSKWRHYYLTLLSKEFLRNSEKSYKADNWNLCKMNSKSWTRFQKLCLCFVYTCHEPTTSVVTVCPLSILHLFPFQQLENTLGQNDSLKVSFGSASADGLTGPVIKFHSLSIGLGESLNRQASPGYTPNKHPCFWLPQDLIIARLKGEQCQGYMHTSRIWSNVLNSSCINFN